MQDREKLGLVAHLPPEEWQQVQQAGVAARFAPRAVMLRQGDTGQHVHVILAGCVKVVRSESDGGHAMLTLRAAGDVVGDLSAVDQMARSATVTALTPTVTRLLSGPQFRHFLNRPAFAAGFAAYTVRRLRDADEQRVAMAVLPVRDRLARTLLHLDREVRRSTGRPGIGLAQSELAELVGASRNAVVTELTALREAGIVTTGRRTVVIVDPAALSDWSAGSG
ncbi:Crp/Fnr family transcriptional regulator [Solwaraspora sp. WMMD791]|uniref:Crp/Fnr family transcriptional regulator n=1 Tax=Solwaraspora sp. WMMD791 TaxID=3016086 RepID=UPI002499B1C8|nr:Crp/Fnr family transcriptional regulator [Solwaraspora sp. WMMD791]WFE28264.1 Crp/Fnr family transcriptional regulator [Solwaraspora sp. WMMD791]